MSAASSPIKCTHSLTKIKQQEERGYIRTHWHDNFRRVFPNDRKIVFFGCRQGRVLKQRHLPSPTQDPGQKHHIDRVLHAQPADRPRQLQMLRTLCFGLQRLHLPCAAAKRRTGGSFRKDSQLATDPHVGVHLYAMINPFILFIS